MSLKDSIFITGMMSLLKDIGSVLTVASPIVGGVAVGYFFLRRSAADEMDHKKWSNRITVAIGSGIAGALGGALMSLVGKYFGL